MIVDICNRCEGSGEVEDHTTHCTTNKDCNMCNGTGRIKRMRYSLEFPYDIDNSTIIELDRKIHQEYREVLKDIKSDWYKRQIKVNKIIN